MSRTASLDVLKGSPPLDVLMSMACGSSPEADSLFSNMLESPETAHTDPTGVAATPGSRSSASVEPQSEAGSKINDDIRELKKLLSSLQKKPNADNTKEAKSQKPTGASEEESTSELETASGGEIAPTDESVETTEDECSPSASIDQARATEIVAQILLAAQQIIQTLQQRGSHDGDATDAGEAAQTSLMEPEVEGESRGSGSLNANAVDGTPTGLLVELMKKIEKRAQRVLEGLTAKTATTTEDAVMAKDIALASGAMEQLKNLATGIESLLNDLRGKKTETQASLIAEVNEPSAEPFATAETTEATTEPLAYPETLGVENFSPMLGTTAADAVAPHQSDFTKLSAGEAGASAIALSLASTHRKAGAPTPYAPSQAPATPLKNGEAIRSTAANASQAAMKLSNAPAQTGLAFDSQPETTSENPLPETLTLKAEAPQSQGIDLNAGSLLNNGSSSFSSVPLPSTLSAEKGQVSGTYSFASTLSAFRSAHGGTVGLPSAVDQVVLQLNRNVKNGQSQMSLQLQPGDLGKITVKLKFTEGDKVQGTVVADNPKTLEMLQKDSRSLERALQDAGLRADPGSLQFSLGEQQNGHDAGQTAGNGKTGADNGMFSASKESEESVGLASLSESFYITPTGVNIQV